MSRARWLSRILGASAVAALASAPAQVHAQQQTFFSHLSGAQETPPVASPGTGTAFLTYTPSTHLLQVDVTFSGLLGNTTASHIHCCIPGAVPGTLNVATQTPTFVGFPLGVHAGSYSHVFDLSLASSYNGAANALLASVGGNTALAEEALIDAIAAGTAYLNIHTGPAGVGFPGGEIRGTFVATPEPSTYALMATGLLALGGIARRRRA